MRIVYHLGAHFTDEERLLKCLLKNRDVLAQHDIVVPAPKRYRALLRETAIALKGQAATRDTQALILEQIMEEDQADRLAQQLRESQRRIDVLNDRLEAMRAIERSLTPRAPAPGARPLP